MNSDRPATYHVALDEIQYVGIDVLEKWACDPNCLEMALCADASVPAVHEPDQYRISGFAEHPQPGRAVVGAVNIKL
jgi:hypothetical protein